MAEATEGQRTLLRRIEAQFRSAVARGAEIFETEGFRIHIWPMTDVFYRNVAVPVRRPRSWPDDVARMIRIFASHRRQARLEVIAELWPELGGALEAAGFVLESRASVMALRLPASPPAGPPPPAVALLETTIADDRLERILEAAASAFRSNHAGTSAHERRQLKHGLAQGQVIAAAAHLEGRPVAGASLIVTGADAELVGVWAARDHRRRGLASAACRHLLDAFAVRAGEFVWLSAREAGAEALYRQLGFSRVGTQLNYYLPA